VRIKLLEIVFLIQDLVLFENPAEETVSCQTASPCCRRVLGQEAKQLGEAWDGGFAPRQGFSQSDQCAVWLCFSPLFLLESEFTVKTDPASEGAFPCAVINSVKK